MYKRQIYNPVPIYMGDKPGALAVDYGVAYFTLETREEAAAILDMIRTLSLIHIFVLRVKVVPAAVGGVGVAVSAALAVAALAVEVAAVGTGCLLYTSRCV